MLELFGEVELWIWSGCWAVGHKRNHQDYRGESACNKKFEKGKRGYSSCCPGGWTGEKKALVPMFLLLGISRGVLWSNFGGVNFV
jgi:hypothetical protein